jgi:hypothetical protein
MGFILTHYSLFPLTMGCYSMRKVRYPYPAFGLLHNVSDFPKEIKGQRGLPLSCQKACSLAIGERYPLVECRRWRLYQISSVVGALRFKRDKKIPSGHVVFNNCLYDSC